MPKIEDKFNVDLTDLHNLLKDVVAYVEVRTGDDDISNDIAREMREIGAVVSESRNSKVTHVIFRDGTLRTSNWAKKHDIPLVDLGWLAACTKHKANLLSRPWHVKYLVEHVDLFGTKKRVRYKKYYKNMNVEDYEAELKRNKKRRQKQLEKSLNNSKSDHSFDYEKYDSPENERIMKRSDPLRKPPTPEIVKRYQARFDRYKKTGRYSWESPEASENESKDEDSLDKEQSLPAEALAKESIIIDQVAEDSVVSSRPMLKSRRLFKEVNESQESLIEPVHKEHSSGDFKASSLPTVVQKGMSSKARKPSKRTSFVLKEENSDNVDVDLVKRQRLSLSINDYTDISLPTKKRAVPLKPVSRPSSANFSQPSLSPLVTANSTPNTADPAKKGTMQPPISPISKPVSRPPSACSSPTRQQPLSPLVTARSTPNGADSNSDSSRFIFVTPKTKKRQSLRTKLLKQSAKKKYQRQQQSCDISTNDEDETDVLVPQTVEPARTSRPNPLVDCSVEFETITETPQSLLLPNKNVTGDSLSSSILDTLLDTPNVSRLLNNIVPDRQRPDSYEHPLFTAKATYDHLGLATLPSFAPQRQYIIQQLTLAQPSMINISLPKATSPTPSPRQLCRVTRGRKSKEPVAQVESYPTENTSPSQHQQQRRRSNRLAEAKPLLEMINVISTGGDDASATNQKQSPVNRKRPWSKVTRTTKPPPPVANGAEIKSKKRQKIRDSLDDFIISYPRIFNRKPSKTSSGCELVLVGFSTEEKNSIKSLCHRLPSTYRFNDIIRSKEQIIVLPENPKRSVNLIKGFVLGNTLVTVKWIKQSVEMKEWLDHSAFIIKEIDLIDMEIVQSTEIPPLFNDYSYMYISPSVVHKYKLRIIIELAGGKVTESFRQAGIVINTRKVNALSVKENWILESIKQGKVLEPKKYLMS